MDSYQHHIYIYSMINILPNEGGTVYSENVLVLHSFRRMMEKQGRKMIDVLELMVRDWGVVCFLRGRAFVV